MDYWGWKEVTMKKFVVISATLLLCAAGAQGGLSVMFDFEGATLGGAAPDYVASANQRVTDYMTPLYGSSVTATGAAAWTNNDVGADWDGKTGTDQWLRTYGSASVTPGYFQISFDTVPVVAGQFQAYVFEATADADFTISFYDSGYGDRYNPNPAALIGTMPADFGVGQIVVAFSSLAPISLMVFSNEGWHDIGVDDLQVTQVPVPGAVLLGLLGLSAAGWRLRRFA